MAWFRRNGKAAPPDAVKAAEFHPTIRETILQLGAFYAGTYGAMYRKQPAVRSVVDWLARNIAELNGKVYERVSDTDRIQVNGHPLAELLRHPNPITTRYDHMFGTVADLAVYDRAYWRKMRVGSKLVVVRLSPALVSVDTDQNTGVRVYRTVNGVEIPPSQLVIFPGYSPDSYDEGVSPLETLRRVLLDETTVSEHRAAMWRNSARQSGWIRRPLEAPEWSDVGRQRFRSSIEEMMSGPSNAGRIGVLEEGMDWIQGGTTPPDTEYVNSRRLTYEEVAIVYFGPIGGRAWLEASTQAGTEENHRQMYQDVLGPWLRRLQDHVELQLLPDVQPIGRNGTYFEFNLAEKLKGSFETQASVLTTSVGVPIMSPNEGRARVNLPRIDDPAYDLPIRPLNVLYGGQAAVTLPTADRSTPELPAAMNGLPSFVKAAPGPAVARRDRAVHQHELLLHAFFTRQERSVLSAKAAVDKDRWDRELADDLLTLARVVARTTGKLAARQLAGVYDEDVALPYLTENARIAAEGINMVTFDALADADDPHHVFEVARGSRSEQLALGRATLLINFARTESAKQSERADGKRRTKTWVVTSRKSRHPEMNGQTVSVSKNFSNGLAWPGDGSGGSADDVAGCHCLLRLND